MITITTVIQEKAGEVEVLTRARGDNSTEPEKKVADALLAQQVAYHQSHDGETMVNDPLNRLKS